MHERPTRADKRDTYRRGSYRMATSPDLNSSRLTSFKLTNSDSPANNGGPWPATLRQSPDPRVQAPRCNQQKAAGALHLEG